MVPATDKVSPKPEKHFVDEVPKGSIICISQPAYMVNAVWGGLMTARAQAQGVLGVVVDGYIRDLNEQREANFSVGASYLFYCSASTKQGQWRERATDIYERFSMCCQCLRRCLPRQHRSWARDLSLEHRPWKSRSRCSQTPIIQL